MSIDQKINKLLEEMDAAEAAIQRREDKISSLFDGPTRTAKIDPAKPSPNFLDDYKPIFGKEFDQDHFKTKGFQSPQIKQDYREIIQRGEFEKNQKDQNLMFEKWKEDHPDVTPLDAFESMDSRQNIIPQILDKLSPLNQAKAYAPAQSGVKINPEDFSFI